MTSKKDIIFVSSEDDRYLVKGGIGTYLGIFTRVLAEEYPDYNVTWVSQSPNDAAFELQEGNVHRIYLPQPEHDLGRYASAVTKNVKKIVDEKIAAGGSIIIEAPEWEGLLADFYKDFHHPQLLKVTRVHTPLAVTAALNQLNIGENEVQQMTREKQQMLSSDLISCPTSYVWEATVAEIFSKAAAPENRVHIPNCINTKTFRPDIQTREKALHDFKTIAGAGIEEGNFNIFILGSVEKRKGSDLVAKMAEKVVQEIPNAHFYFIGHHQKEDGTELTANKKLSVAKLESMISPETRSQVHFTGYVDHDALPSLMSAGDLFVISYLGDNFPGAVAEIGLSKRPLLALLRGGVTEMLKTSDGYAALTMQGTEDIGIINQGAAQIIKHYKFPEEGKQLAEKFYSKLQEEYSESRVVKRLVSSYIRKLEGGTP